MDKALAYNVMVILGHQLQTNWQENSNHKRALSLALCLPALNTASGAFHDCFLLYRLLYVSLSVPSALSSNILI